MNKVFFLDVEDSTHYFLQSIICPNKAVYKYMNDNSIPITIKTLLFGSEKLTLQKTYFYLIKYNPLSNNDQIQVILINMFFVPPPLAIHLFVFVINFGVFFSFSSLSLIIFLAIHLYFSTF